MVYGKNPTHQIKVEPNYPWAAVEPVTNQPFFGGAIHVGDSVLNRLSSRWRWQACNRVLNALAVR